MHTVKVKLPCQHIHIVKCSNCNIIFGVFNRMCVHFHITHEAAYDSLHDLNFRNNLVAAWQRGPYCILMCFLQTYLFNSVLFIIMYCVFRLIITIPYVYTYWQYPQTLHCVLVYLCFFYYGG